MSGKTGPVGPFECEGRPGSQIRGRGARGTRGPRARRMPAPLQKNRRIRKTGRPHGDLLQFVVEEVGEAFYAFDNGVFLVMGEAQAHVVLQA